MSKALNLACAVLASSAVAMSHAAARQTSAPRDRAQSDGPFRFQTGIEIVNVTATVSDPSGRFVSGLRQEDFTVYEDGRAVEITQFSAERVPVSLGIALDTSGSMEGSKMR